MIILNEWLEIWCHVVNMLNCFINAILPNIFTWELKSILSCYLKWDGIMAEVHLLKSKLFKVSDESVPKVSFGHVKCRIFVVL